MLRLAPDTAGRQIVWLFAGIALMVATIILVPSVERLGRYKYTCLLFGLVLLLLPVVPFIGAEYNGSRIWLSIFGLSFQPGEIAKILIVLFLAAYLADNRELLSVMRRSRSGLKYPDFRALVPLLAMWIIAMLIVYCLRGVSFSTPGGWVPQLLCVAVVVALHLWKHNNLLSIFGGTVLYMVLVQAVF